LVGGVCTCGPGLVKTNTGTGCQAQAACLGAQYRDATGQCTCAPGQTVVTYGSGCVAAVTSNCFGVQQLVGGVCQCGAGERAVPYGTGCEATGTATTCLSGQRLVGGACTCPDGATVVTYGSGCVYSVPRACNPNLEVRAPGGGCQRCPAYQRPQNGVCAAPTCGLREFLDSNGLCFPCNAGTVATADGRSCRWPGRSLLLGDDIQTEEAPSAEDADQFYLDETRSIKSMVNNP